MNHLSALAQIELFPEEAEQAERDIAAMLDHIKKLQDLDTAGVEPMFHIFPMSNVFRDDMVTKQDECQRMLEKAPGGVKDGGFKVPKTIEQEGSR